MADSQTSRYRARKQSVGSNTNTWGDGKLNDNLDILDRGSKGYESTTITGDTTVTWTDYATSNVGQVAFWLITGSLSSTATVTVPAYGWYWQGIKNTTGASITVKVSGGTGITIPNGRTVSAYNNTTDVYFATPNYLGDDITEANNRDLTDRAYVDAAIAASVPAGTAGTIFHSGADTTRDYHGAKHTISFTTATTTQLSGLLSVSMSTQNAGGNEKHLLTFGYPEVAGYLDGGRQAGPFTAAAGYAYNVVSGCTFYLPSSPSQSAKMRIALFPPSASYNINPNGKKINNSTSALSVSGGQTFEITYDATLGDWE